jgi:uncharacterized protein
MGTFLMKKRHTLALLIVFMSTAWVSMTPSPVNSAESPRKKVNRTLVAIQEVKVGTRGDELYFDKNTISAKAGATLKITFTNQASPSSALQHNLLVIQPGKLEEVANAALVAGPDKGYIPDSPLVLGHTQLLAPGQSETLALTLPNVPGDYPYFCSYPGHPLTMNGILKVKS